MSSFIPLPPTYAVSDPQVRAVLDVLARNMEAVIATTSTTSTSTSIGGASTFGSGNNSTNITNLAPAYTLDTLTADLKRGAAAVITGALNGTTVMKLEPAGQYVVFQHKDAIVLGNTGAYTGTVRTALGITSTGILGGYNDKTSGAWQTTFAIESATGNLTLLGTIRAASIISVDAYLGSTLVSTVLANSASVTAKLNKSAADILSGTIEFQSAGGFKTGTVAVDSSGNATGAGVAITSKGIVGRNAGATTFTIDATTGAATFGGDLVAASGSFVGTVSAGAIIAGSVTLNSVGGTSLTLIASQASGALPSASFSSTLQTNLNAGVTNILAGTGSNYRLTVDATNAFIAFSHKDAVYNGTTYTGSGIRPAIGISAAGIAMGYNDAGGTWQNAVALSSTGDLTVKGTITAGSIIVGSVTIGSGGTTLTAVESNASSALSTAGTANTNANSALAAVANKLSKSASDILSGSIDFSSYGGFKTSEMTIAYDGTASGQGVAFTSKGIVGRNASGTTFTLDATTGAATFSGNITGGANINITGYGIFEGYSGSGQNTSAIIANSGNGAYAGVTAYTTSDYSFGGAIKAFCNSTGGGFALSNGGNAVMGWQQNPTYGVGVFGFAGGALSTGVRAVGGAFGVVASGVIGIDAIGSYQSGSVGGRFDTNYPGGYAIQIVGGSFRYGSTTIQPPPNSNLYFLAGDGAWYSLSSVTSGVSSFNGRTSAVTLSSADVTTALGYTPPSSAVSTFNSRTGAVSLSYTDVVNALGYTPPSSAVSSFNGRGGAVTLNATDLVNTSPSSSYFLSGVGWIPVTVVNTLNGSSGAVTNAFAATVSYPSVGFSVSGSGTNSVTYNIYQTSDRSLKRDIQNSDRGLEFIKRLTPRSYYWNSEHMTFDKRTYGLIADEVLAACDGEETSLAYTNHAGVMAGKMAVDYTSMVPVLVKAIQELSAKVQILEAR